MADTLIALPAAPPQTARIPRAPLDEPVLGKLLGALAARPGPVPKYRYPSAGTLYPVQSYIVLSRPLGGLAAGSYYHDPVAHALVALSGATPAAPDGTSPPALLVLVARGAAIDPIYGAHADTLCLLEAGYMEAALDAAGTGLTLRDAGDPAGQPALANAFALAADDRPLVSGAIGEWAIGETT